VMTEMAPGTRRRFLHISAIIARHFSARPRGRDPRTDPNQSR
jgi:hypothetical protein